jgi:hypothetical protein
MLTLLLSSTFALAAGKATGSSVKEDADGKHTADMAFDGLMASGWAEGEMGYGEHCWLELDLGAATDLDSVSLWPGNLSEGSKSYKEYSRPRLIRVLVDGKQVGDPIRLQDEMQRKDIPVDVTGRVVRIEVDEVFEGAVYPDLYIAELAANFSEGERARQVEKVDAWRTGKEGIRLQEDYEKKVLAAFDAHFKNSDDMESMAFLVSAAGDGPEFLRKKVTSLVPIGYRAAAMVPDQKAVEAIRKLKDPNGIPGLEMAALRAIGKEQKEFRDIIDYFQAYAELKGGGRRSIDAWGERGWEVGALQSFGEPLAIEANAYGEVYVADTANNRVQMFNPDGLSVKQYGAQPDVTNQWFAKTRKWYVGGSGASDAAGGFVNPVDVELIPGKDADGFVVLDARGRVQVYDEEGHPTIGWKVRTEQEVEDKVGGDAYLAYLPKKQQIIVIIGKEAIVYGLDSAEVTRWTVEDGVPNGCQVGADGRLYLVFGDEVVSYNPKGYRYETVIDKAILGIGYEDVDVTVDEKGKMWVLTDTGWVFSFKKPGKLEWKVQVSEIPLERPRFAVVQGMTFITDRDRIVAVDALQRHVDEVEAASRAKEAKAVQDAQAEPVP